MMKYKEGDILLFKGSNAFNNLIRLGTLSKYSHAAILLSIDNKHVVAEAQAKGFVFNEYWAWLDEKVAENYIDVYREVELKPEEFQKIKEYCEQAKGTPYGWIDIVKIGLNKLSGRLLFKSSARQLICSEAVVRAYRAAGIDLVLGKEPDYVTPADLGDTDALVKIK